MSKNIYDKASATPEKWQELATKQSKGKSPDDLTCPAGIDCSPPPLHCVGVECVDAGFQNKPVRTLWTQDGIE